MSFFLSLASMSNPALKRDWLTAGFRPLPASPLAPRWALVLQHTTGSDLKHVQK